MNKSGKTILTVVLVIAVVASLIVLFTGDDEEAPEVDPIEEAEDVEPDEEPVEEEPEEVSVHLRVEGIEENIYSGEVTTTAEEDVVAIDKLETALEEEGIDYEMDEFEGSVMVTSIAGEEAGTFGEMDGWLYMVNGEMQPGGADEYAVEDGEEVVFFYGEYPPATLIPQVDVDPSPVDVGEDFTVTVTAQYDDFDTGETITEEVEGATVMFREEEYTTDESGQVEISAGDQEGEFDLAVSKDREDSFPALVRTSDSIQVPVRAE